MFLFVCFVSCVITMLAAGMGWALNLEGRSPMRHKRSLKRSFCVYGRGAGGSLRYGSKTSENCSKTNEAEEARAPTRHCSPYSMFASVCVCACVCFSYLQVSSPFHSLPGIPLTSPLHLANNRTFLSLKDERLSLDLAHTPVCTPCRSVPLCLQD